MAKVKVFIQNNQEEIKIPVGIRMLIRKCCHAVLYLEGIDFDTEISVSFVNNQQIKALNMEYRNIDKSTDVLSFPLGEDGEFDYNNSTKAYALGDIVISLETAVKQAEIYGHSLEREIGFLTVHSMLHLLGYDHEINGIEALKMREKEEQVLSELGISRIESYIKDEN